jgi:exo-beta-1,3-glucanase (GH17 family)
VKLLSGTRAAIKREDSRAIVSTAGMPNSKLRGSVPLTTYLASMYRANGRKKFDLISVHPYAKDTGSAKSILKSVRSVMSKYGDSSKRIAVTELGWASSGPKSSPYVMTKSGQASRLGSCLKMLTGSTGTAYRVMGIIVFSFQDRSLRPGELDWWGPHTGLFDVTGKPKPAWAQFKKYAK